MTFGRVGSDLTWVWPGVQTRVQRHGRDALVVFAQGHWFTVTLTP